MAETVTDSLERQLAEHQAELARRKTEVAPASEIAAVRTGLSPEEEVVAATSVKQPEPISEPTQRSVIRTGISAEEELIAAGEHPTAHLVSDTPEVQDTQKKIFDVLGAADTTPIYQPDVAVPDVPAVTLDTSPDDLAQTADEINTASHALEINQRAAEQIITRTEDLVQEIRGVGPSFTPELEQQFNQINDQISTLNTEVETLVAQAPDVGAINIQSADLLARSEHLAERNTGLQEDLQSWKAGRAKPEFGSQLQEAIDTYNEQVEQLNVDVTAFQTQLDSLGFETVDGALLHPTLSRLNEIAEEGSTLAAQRGALNIDAALYTEKVVADVLNRGRADLEELQLQTGSDLEKLNVAIADFNKGIDAYNEYGRVSAQPEMRRAFTERGETDVAALDAIELREVLDKLAILRRPDVQDAFALGGETDVEARHAQTLENLLATVQIYKRPDVRKTFTLEGETDLAPIMQEAAEVAADVYAARQATKAWEESPEHAQYQEALISRQVETQLQPLEATTTEAQELKELRAAEYREARDIAEEMGEPYTQAEHLRTTTGIVLPEIESETVRAFGEQPAPLEDEAAAEAQKAGIPVLSQVDTLIYNIDKKLTGLFHSNPEEYQRRFGEELAKGLVNYGYATKTQTMLLVPKLYEQINTAIGKDAYLPTSEEVRGDSLRAAAIVAGRITQDQAGLLARIDQHDDELLSERQILEDPIVSVAEKQAAVERINTLVSLRNNLAEKLEEDVAKSDDPGFRRFISILSPRGPFETVILADLLMGGPLFTSALRGILGATRFGISTGIKATVPSVRLTTAGLREVPVFRTAAVQIASRVPTGAEVLAQARALPVTLRTLPTVATKVPSVMGRGLSYATRPIRSVAGAIKERIILPSHIRAFPTPTLRGVRQLRAKIPVGRAEVDLSKVTPFKPKPGTQAPILERTSEAIGDVAERLASLAESNITPLHRYPAAYSAARATGRAIKAVTLDPAVKLGQTVKTTATKVGGVVKKADERIMARITKPARPLADDLYFGNVPPTGHIIPEGIIRQASAVGEILPEAQLTRIARQVQRLPSAAREIAAIDLGMPRQLASYMSGDAETVATVIRNYARTGSPVATPIFGRYIPRVAAPIEEAATIPSVPAGYAAGQSRFAGTSPIVRGSLALETTPGFGPQALALRQGTEVPLQLGRISQWTPYVEGATVLEPRLDEIGRPIGTGTTTRPITTIIGPKRLIPQRITDWGKPSVSALPALQRYGTGYVPGIATTAPERYYVQKPATNGDFTQPSRPSRYGPYAITTTRGRPAIATPLTPEYWPHRGLSTPTIPLVPGYWPYPDTSSKPESEEIPRKRKSPFVPAKTPEKISVRPDTLKILPPAVSPTKQIDISTQQVPKVKKYVTPRLKLGTGLLAARPITSAVVAPGGLPPSEVSIISPLVSPATRLGVATASAQAPSVEDVAAVRTSQISGRPATDISATPTGPPESLPVSEGLGLGTTAPEFEVRPATSVTSRIGDAVAPAPSPAEVTLPTDFVAESVLPSKTVTRAKTALKQKAVERLGSQSKIDTQPKIEPEQLLYIDPLTVPAIESEPFVDPLLAEGLAEKGGKKQKILRPGEDEEAAKRKDKRRPRVGTIRLRRRVEFEKAEWNLIEYEKQGSISVIETWGPYDIRSIISSHNLSVKGRKWIARELFRTRDESTRGTDLIISLIALGTLHPDYVDTVLPFKVQVPGGLINE